MAVRGLPRAQSALVIGSDWREFAPLELLPTLAGAMQVFPVKGYHGSTVRDLAAAAGITLPTLYHYHGDKQQVLVDLLFLGFDEFLERAARARAATPADPASQLDCLVEVAVLHMVERHELAVLDAEIRYLERHNRTAYMTKRRSFEDQLVDVLTAGTADGPFRMDHPRDVGRAVLGMVQAITGWYRTDGPLGLTDLVERYQAMTRRMAGMTHPRV